MNTIGDGSSHSYYSSSLNNMSHQIKNSQVVDATDNDSLASGITMESFQEVTSEMAKIQVYLRQILEHLSLLADGIPTENNSVNKASESSKTTWNFL